MIENTFIRIDGLIIRVNLIKSIFDAFREGQNVCVIRFTDGTESLHKGVCAEDFWKALGKIK